MLRWFMIHWYGRQIAYWQEKRDWAELHRRYYELKLLATHRQSSTSSNSPEGQS